MTCPASITIAGIEYPCGGAIVPHPIQTARHYAVTPDGTAYWSQDVAPPERKWQAGDLVCDARGHVYMRRHQGNPRFDEYPWMIDACWRSDSDLVRPLRRLVPASEPVDLNALADVIGGTCLRPEPHDIARAVCEHLGLEVKK